MQDPPQNPDSSEPTSESNPPRPDSATPRPSDVTVTQLEDAITRVHHVQRLSNHSNFSDRTAIEEHGPDRTDDKKVPEVTIEEMPAEEQTAEERSAPTNPGFSASQFASYEQRMKDAITKSETTTLAGFPPSQRSSAFVVASDLEKGFGSKENVYTVTKEIAAPPAVGPYDSVQIPPKRQVKAVRNVRHTLLNVYRRLFSLVFLGNMIAFIYFVVQWWRTAPPAGKHSSVSSRIPLSALSTAASANILVAILIRQDYIVNLLFKSLWWLPHSWPLRIRRMAAKVYENGGVHSGAAVAGTVWFILLTVCLNVDFIQQGWKSDGGWIAVLVLTYVLVIMLISIVLIAYPRFRFMSHNTFEYSHRFAGWSAIAIFWAELVLLGRQTAASTGEQLGHVLIRQPTFWILLVISFHIILPWLRLRKWTFTPEQLSNHALRLRFSKDIPPLSGLAIAEHPLGEWHPFATFPNWDSHVDASGHVNTDIDQEERGLPIIRSGRTNRAGGVGGSMIISDAGDWTKRTILEPRTQYWVKGVPKTGVLSMAFLFSRVVVVTTGSGIGPCLSFLLEPSRKNTACRVLWSTPAPLRTYGAGILNSVRAVDKDALIIDTRASGRPDMVSLTYNLYVELRAEAVFVISNPKLTRKLVYAMESRGIPAFGPVWDS